MQDEGDVMARLVDDRTLEQWRALDALYVLTRLGCYTKRDVSFHPITATHTARYNVNANERDWELLLTGSKFWDTRAKKGGGGAIDLAIYLFGLDFKSALRMLAKALPETTLIPGSSNGIFGADDGPP